jgi:hypothetical protein
MDLNNLQTWQYFAIAGGAVLVLGFILYFLPIGKAKMPGVVTSGFGGTALGLGLGVVLMASLGYQTNPGAPPAPGADGAGPPAAPKGQGRGGPPAKGGGQKVPMEGFGGGGGGGGQPNSKVLLSGLVIALDRVADRPVTITLTPEQRQAIAEQLKGLDAAAELSEEDAKARLDAIHKVVEKDKDALEAVGYRGFSPPGKGGGGGGLGKEQPPNPFKQGTAAERLKSLNDRLAGKR